MSAFSAAVDLIFADPNMAVDATWLRGGVAPAIPCRVIRARPDEIVDYGAARIVSASQRLDVRCAEVSDPARGDLILIGIERFRVQSQPRADRERLVWSIDAVPE